MKKILALLLTVGMVLGLFAGCGNSNTTPAGTAAANVLFFILDSSLSLNGMVSHSKTCLQICVFPALTVNHTKTRLLY